MASGLKALHDIDRAISKARKNVSEASRLPGRASNALADVKRKQAAAYGEIAKLRLDLIEDGAGGDLGYVDRQAGKLLTAHAKEEKRLMTKADTALGKITKFEEQRTSQEKLVETAVLAYDKAALVCQKILVKDKKYIVLLEAVETAEAKTERADAKRELAEGEAEEKGAPYRNDPYFNYLKKRAYGTKDAKGWFLTQVFDGMIARKLKYRGSALNYQRLTAIPGRLARHVIDLEVKEEAARVMLKAEEEAILIREGVTKLKKASLSAQTKLDAIDAKLEVAEDNHQALRSELARVSGGENEPYRQAMDMLVDVLGRKDVSGLRRLASQTMSRDDDRAIEHLIALSKDRNNLKEDRAQARKLLDKYQDSLKDLERLRRRFKNRRYDAPSSQFPGSSFGGSLLGALLGQMIAGIVSGNDVWRQIERAQRTVRRHSDMDFGGVDWNKAMRLPRSRSRNSGSIFGGSGGFGGGFGGGTTRRRTRTPRPRTPRPRSKGGFRTGGGF